ncbi:MAG: CPBP family intramembrane metalloprotease, partial [Tidjanibacter sp.]|nr:CPBP family intramembrane metalloprotease [Tidjanibacter sp.]
MNNDAEVKNSVAEAENTPAQSGSNVPQNEVKNEPAKEVEKEPRKQRKFPSWIDLFALAGVFVFSALLGSVVFTLCGGLDATTKPGWALPLYYTIQMLPPIIFVIWQRCKLGKGWGIHFGLGNLSAPLLMWGVVLLMASSVVIEPLLALFPAEDYNAVTDLVGKGAWSILSVVVCAPLFEEMLFRGL